MVSQLLVILVEILFLNLSIVTMVGVILSIIRENDFEDEFAESMQLYNREIVDKLVLIRIESVKLESEIIVSFYLRFFRFFKIVLIVQCVFIGFFFIIVGVIYYLVLSVIERKFDIDEELVNVIVVVYFVFQGFVFIFMGGFVDLLGRRSVVFVVIVIYFGVCIGFVCV